MVLSTQMRLVLVCLLVTICCVYADGDYEKLVRALATKSSDRQFISTIRKWFSRGDPMEKMKMKTMTPTRTKIKYLPVYVPYPVQGPVKVPQEGEYYGAYEDPKKKEIVESIYQGVHVVPNSHVSEYYLPYSGQLPVYTRRKGQTHFYTPIQHAPPISYEQPQIQVAADSGHYGYGEVYSGDTYESEAFEDDDTGEYDSEVVENAELLKEAYRGRPAGSRLRKIRRKVKTHSPRSFAF